jgi:hypothetical protein
MPTVRNFDWGGPARPDIAPAGTVDFVSYLRVALLECGGFPGLYGSDGFEPWRAQLVSGLGTF